MYICLSFYAYTYIYLYTSSLNEKQRLAFFTCIHLYLFVYVCIYTYIRYPSVNSRGLHLRQYYTFRKIFRYEYISLFICVFISICIYIYISLCMYLYTLIHFTSQWNAGACVCESTIQSENISACKHVFIYIEKSVHLYVLYLCKYKITFMFSNQKSISVYTCISACVYTYLYLFSQ